MKFETFNLKLKLNFLNFLMKAKITIMPKQAVLDPQGKAVLNALKGLGYKGATEVKVGKYIEMKLSDCHDKRQLDEVCHRFLSNPLIEDYRIEFESSPFSK